MDSSHTHLPSDHPLPAEPGSATDAWAADVLTVSSPQELAPLRGEYRQPPRKLWLPLLLFLATCLSTFVIGALSCYPHARQTPTLVCIAEGWLAGLQYMTAVMAILVAHEMGHFLQAVRHRIPASFPFFIPLPLPPIGTMGAVMGMEGSRADRKQLFDIGISGPLAGLVVAIPIAAYGIWTADVGAPADGLVSLQDPLLFKALIHWLRPALPSGHDLQPSPLLMAAWVGMLITGLNMLPISQLDGGHVAYALFGRRAHLLARVVMLAAVVFILVSKQYQWCVMLALIFCIGPYHPPTADDAAPMGLGRRLIGLASLAIPILCFIPEPVKAS